MAHYTMHMANAFLLTLVLIYALNPIAARLGLVDFPQGRKMHLEAVPTTGGLAMFVAFILPMLQLEPPLHIYWSLVIGLSMIVLIGVVDDMLALGPWTKLVGQIAAALVMTLPGHHLIGIDTLLGITGSKLPQMDLALTVFFIVGVVNAFNMLDGLDGLAGGAAAAGLLSLAIVASLSGMIGVLVHVLLLVCAVFGFLIFNLRHPWRRRASVYMGDAGSMLLGAAIAFLTLVLCAGPEKAAPLPALLWFFALPMFETLILIVRRLATGDNPLRGDRRHLHHLLLRAGISHQAASPILIAACVVLGAIGLIGWRLGAPDYLMLLGLIGPLILHVYVVLFGWQVIGRRYGILRTERAAAARVPQAVGD
jgi:UDP-GlcNAc:undecaprenyl-phosphate GlcNAc-1-phosphate transferase